MIAAAAAVAEQDPLAFRRNTDPPKLSYNNYCHNWAAWKARWIAFLSGSGIDDLVTTDKDASLQHAKIKEIKRSALFAAFDEAVIDMVEDMDIADKGDPDSIIEALELRAIESSSSNIQKNLSQESLFFMPSVQIMLPQLLVFDGSISIKEPAKNHFDKLPDEVVIAILDFLALPDILQVLRVSKRLRRVGSGAVTSLDLKHDDVKGILPPLTLLVGDPFVYVPQVIRLLGLFPRVRRLQLIPELRQDAAVHVSLRALRMCPMLEELTDVNCRDAPTPSLFRAIGSQACPSLRRIGLWNAHLEPSMMRNLTHVKLILRYPLDNQRMCEVVELGVVCKGLESFWLLYDEMLRQIRTEFMRDFLHEVSGTLKELFVVACVMTHESYEKVAQCQLLEKVWIRRALWLSTFALRSVLLRENLRSLEIIECSRGPDDMFSSAFSDLKLDKLESLTLYIKWVYLTSNSILAIVNSCPGLRQFSLGSIMSDDFDISDDVFRQVILEKLPKLTELTLQQFANLTPAAFHNIKNHMPDLRIVRLSNWANIPIHQTRILQLSLQEQGITLLQKRGTWYFRREEVHF